MGMILTDEQQAILDGAKGETMAKVMKTLVMFGEAFHAEKMVPVTSRYNHLVTSFGLGVLQPVYDLMQQLSTRAPSPARNSRQTPPRSTPMSRQISCSSSCSKNSCTTSRTFMRASWKSWDF